MKSKIDSKVRAAIIAEIHLTETLTDDELFEELRWDGEEIESHKEYKSRWWTEHTYVVKLGNTLFGYAYAEATGDMSVGELGYEPDYSSICLMEPYQVTTTKYRKVDN